MSVEKAHAIFASSSSLNAVIMGIEAEAIDVSNGRSSMARRAHDHAVCTRFGRSVAVLLFIDDAARDCISGPLEWSPSLAYAHEVLVRFLRSKCLMRGIEAEESEVRRGKSLHRRAATAQADAASSCRRKSVIRLMAADAGEAIRGLWHNCIVA